MRLNVTKKGEEEKKHNENVRKGKNAKRKGGNYERKIAKLFQDRYGVELKRTPQSGGFAKKSSLADDYRGDITIVDPKNYLKLHIECKDHKTLSLPAWIRQAKEDCPENRIPIVIFHQHQSSEDFVCLNLKDFFSIVEKDKVIAKRSFRKDESK